MHKSQEKSPFRYWAIHQISENKDNNHHANITWEVLARHHAYNTRSKTWWNEKQKIALHRNNNMLNQQTEILNKCRHRNKYALISYDSKD